MSEYYKSQRGSQYCYHKVDTNPFKISRSKIDLFLECPRCFYIDRVLGTGRPPGFPFALNSAVDHLLKQEFDIHRANSTQHPLIEKYGVDARPVAHESLNLWRDNFTGIQYLHKPTNLLVFGAIDDLWINSKQEYIVVDYKSTSKAEDIVELDKEWQIGYKRQMEVYQWLLRQNGYEVSNTGYFVYCNGDTDKKAFDGRLEFKITLIPYLGNDGWIEKTILDIKKCLDSDVIPPVNEDCDYCLFFQTRNGHEAKYI